MCGKNRFINDNFEIKITLLSDDPPSDDDIISSKVLTCPWSSVHNNSLFPEGFHAKPVTVARDTGQSLKHKYYFILFYIKTENIRWP